MLVEAEEALRLWPDEARAACLYTSWERYPKKKPSPGLSLARGLSLINHRMKPPELAAMLEDERLASFPLRVMLLNYSTLAWAGSKVLAASPRMASVTSLDLYGTDITCTGVRALAASPHLSALTDLNLSSCPINSAGVISLMSSAMGQRLVRVAERDPGVGQGTACHR